MGLGISIWIPVLRSQNFGIFWVCVRILISAFGSQDLIFGIGFQDLYLWVWISKFGPTGMGFRIRISGFGSQDLDLCVWVSGFGFLFLHLWIWFNGFGSQDLDICVWVSGFGSLG